MINATKQGDICNFVKICKVVNSRIFLTKNDLCVLVSRVKDHVCCLFNYEGKKISAMNNYSKQLIYIFESFRK